MMSKNASSRLLVTSGEPAGIGPDLIIKLQQMDHNYNLTVIGDPDLLKKRAELLSIPIDIEIISEKNTSNEIIDNKSLKVLPVKLNTDSKPGVLDVRNVDYVIKMIKMSCQYCLENNFDALITTPVQKSIINDAGIKFSGHTEYMAKEYNVDLPVMLLDCEGFRVALVTTHMPLTDVPKYITVCGLNPHAGEDGYLGREEKEYIKPVINKFIKKGYDVSGPIPADTAFREEKRGKTDVFISMYHDQGLPVLKTFGFGETVNITLGLPIIRTSVDHGTALEIAGTGKAECSSLLAAINMANKMIKNNHKH